MNLFTTTHQISVIQNPVIKRNWELTPYQVKLINACDTAFRETRLPRNAIDFLYEHAVLTGGAYASILNNEEPFDFDFYFRSEDKAYEFMGIVEKVKRTAQTNNYGDKRMEWSTVSYGKIQVILFNQTPNIPDFDFLHAVSRISLNTDHTFTTHYFSECLDFLCKRKILVDNMNYGLVSRKVHKGYTRAEVVNSGTSSWVPTKHEEKLVKRGWGYTLNTPTLLELSLEDQMKATAFMMHKWFNEEPNREFTDIFEQELFADYIMEKLTNE